MAGHSRWKTLQARRLAETGDAGEHPEYEQAGRDLRLGDQLRVIRRSRNLTQKEVAKRSGISQPALSRIELGGGVPDIETLRRLGNATTEPQLKAYIARQTGTSHDALPRRRAHCAPDSLGPDRPISAAARLLSASAMTCCRSSLPCRWAMAASAFRSGS